MSMLLILITWNGDVEAEEGNKRTDNIWLIIWNYLIPPTQHNTTTVTTTNAEFVALFPNSHMMFSYKQYWKPIRSFQTTRKYVQRNVSICIYSTVWGSYIFMCGHFTCLSSQQYRSIWIWSRMDGWINGMAGLGWMAGQQAGCMNGRLAGWMNDVEIKLLRDSSVFCHVIPTLIIIVYRYLRHVFFLFYRRNFFFFLWHFCFKLARRQHHDKL